jgi:hypothetical protein
MLANISSFWPFNLPHPIFLPAYWHGVHDGMLTLLIVVALLYLLFRKAE